MHMQMRGVTRHGQRRYRGAGIGAAVLVTCLTGWSLPHFAHAQPFTISQITNTTGGQFGSLLPSISAAGTRIAFVSDRDLTPGNSGNADRNREIFLFDTITNTFT